MPRPHNTRMPAATDAGRSLPRRLATVAALAILAAWAMLTCLAAPARAEPRPATVFAAASLTDALEAVAQAYVLAGGTRPRLSFAASSTLARQIEAGAGAQIFISADEAWMDYLATRGLLAPGTRRPLAGNRLVLVVPAAAAMALDLTNSDWLDRLPKGRIVTGDPAHVPVGRYARQALTALGVWPAVEPRLARADSVRAALVLVERGEAAAGIVYATDVAASRQVAVAATFPETAHEPIVYPIALLAGAEGGEGRRLYDFLVSPATLAILAKQGFITR